MKCLLNIFPNLPNEVWADIEALYRELKGWIGFERMLDKELACWFGTDVSEVHIFAYGSDSGLVIKRNIDEDLWEKWSESFIDRVSLIVDYNVEICEI